VAHPRVRAGVSPGFPAPSRRPFGTSLPPRPVSPGRMLARQSRRVAEPSRRPVPHCPSPYRNPLTTGVSRPETRHDDIGS
jgi:hypothetical protein